MLQSAAVSDGAAPRVMIGHVETKTWSRLSEDEKRAAAVGLVRGAREDEATIALFYDDSDLVAVIEEGVLTWIH